jgi:hypothetical protein
VNFLRGDRTFRLHEGVPVVCHFGVLDVREETCFVPSVNSSKCVCTQVFNSCTVKEKGLKARKSHPGFVYCHIEGLY